jgi:hypothetical protein
MVLFPVGACFLQSFFWFTLYLRSIKIGYRMDILFLARTLWLTFGIAICVILASELTKRGVFHRRRFSSDSIALAGELNLFLGLIGLSVLINGHLGEIRLPMGLLLLSFFMAAGLSIFGLFCIKSSSLSGDQFKTAENMAVINGALAILGTLYMIGFWLLPSYA